MEDINTAEKNADTTEQKVPSTSRDRVARWLVGSGITAAVTGAALAEVYPNHASPLLGAAVFGLCINVGGAIYGDPWHRPESEPNAAIDAPIEDAPTTAETVETAIDPLSAVLAQNAEQ